MGRSSSRRARSFSRRWSRECVAETRSRPHSLKSAPLPAASVSAAKRRATYRACRRKACRYTRSRRPWVGRCAQPTLGAKSPSRAEAAVAAELVRFSFGRIDWAALLKRVYDVDAPCPCEGRLRFIALILEREVAQGILQGIGRFKNASVLTKVVAGNCANSVQIVNGATCSGTGKLTAGLSKTTINNHLTVLAKAALDRGRVAAAFDGAAQQVAEGTSRRIRLTFDEADHLIVGAEDERRDSESPALPAA